MAPLQNKSFNPWLLIVICFWLVLIIGGIILWPHFSRLENNKIPQHQQSENFCKNQCGDGVCQEIVCLAIGCPCAETKENCPQDCPAKDETADTLTENETMANKSLITKEFSYPYSLSWQENYSGYSINYDLTKITIGDKTIDNFSSYSSAFKKGDKTNALTLYFKIIKIGQIGSGICLRINFRMELNEQGDLAAPVNNSFNADCFWDNQTYYDQEVIFEVSQNKKEFSITTGGKSNIFFTVKVLDNGDISVEKNPASEGMGTKDCSAVPDGVCTKYCAAGSDYDCCVAKGYQWINGKGCY
jgi:hypothetical protein